MRAIDADALEKEGWSLHRDIQVDKNTFEYQTKPLKQVPTIETEPHWIPCSERLPKKDGEYLVSGRWASGKEAVGDCEYSLHDGFFWTAWNFDVIAWMPFPRPYREGENDW